jgi:lysophospholipase L1-like esterase
LRKKLQTIYILVAILAGMLSAAAQAAAPVADRMYIFTDETMAFPLSAGKHTWDMRTITRSGWGPSAHGEGEAPDGWIEIKPLDEGIHIVYFDGDPKTGKRFLAVNPPARLSDAARRRIQAALPHTANILLSGKPYLIVAMGDSVTWTGEYEKLLTMLLQRATGNKNITALNKGYTGRSVDAAVRFFDDDIVPNHPQLGLLMYGQNDQACGASMEGYVAQYRSIVERLTKECGADAVLLQPTPHIEIPVYEPATNVAFAFRTIAFAEDLRRLAERVNVPLAETFQAIWGAGGSSVEDSARLMWPLYPPNFDERFRSILETNGKGDIIHPNVLGHLAMARSVFDALTGEKPSSPLAISGVSRWTTNGVASRLTIQNVSQERRQGALGAYSVHHCGKAVLIPVKEDVLLEPERRLYQLAPGESMTLEIAWPQAKTPESLLEYPLNRDMAQGAPFTTIVDFSEGKTRVYGVFVPFENDATFVHERLVVEGRKFDAKLRVKGTVQPVPVVIPEHSEVGRIPLVRKVENGDRIGWAVAQAAYVRYGGALTGEAQTDGALTEWDGHVWSPVGEKVQARWAEGIIDNRATPEECYLRWAFKAGSNGMFMAAHATGNVTSDWFTVFFDSRAPAVLGTPGRYYWIVGHIESNGEIRLEKGETSKLATGLTGTWKKTAGGLDLEMFVPYDLMQLSTWPVSGDLGLSIWWQHFGPGGTTNLQWSEDGHPWSSLWYGVVRLMKSKGASLPYRVRIQ